MVSDVQHAGRPSRAPGSDGALAAVTLLGERCSLGSLIESTPGPRRLDALGRYP